MKKLLAIIYSFLLLNIASFAQKRIVDTSSFRNWKELSSPRISPNGEYFLYCTEDDFTDRSVMEVKSIHGRWFKRFNIKKGYFNGVLTDSVLIFRGDNDTVFVVSLGKDFSYHRNVTSFKVSQHNGNKFGLLNNSGLKLFCGEYVREFPGVADFYFTFDPNLLVLKYDTVEKQKPSTYLELFNLKNGKVKRLSSSAKVSDIVFNVENDKMAFSTQTDRDRSEISILDLRREESFTVSVESGHLDRICGFNKASSLLFFMISQDVQRYPEENAAEVTIWRYNDDNLPLTKSQPSAKEPSLYSVKTIGGTPVKISTNFDQLGYLPSYEQWGEEILLSQTCGSCNAQEQLWNPACKRKWFIVNLHTGNRKPFQTFDTLNVLNRYIYSPNLEFVVYFDETTKSYFSYSLKKNAIFELTGPGEKKIFADEPKNFPGYLGFDQRGIAGWCLAKKQVFIYDAADIWKFDLEGREMPINITNFFGRRNDLTISFLFPSETDLEPCKDFFLTALSNKTKDNFFLKCASGRSKDPELLSGGAYIYYLPFYASGSYNGMRPIKAKSNGSFIVRRESTRESPNYYFTNNFIDYIKLTDLKPESQYEWFQSELVEWKNVDGRTLQGVLYKPDNFDSSRKYPVIFNIYQQLSNSKNAYIKPEAISNSCNINIPLLISRGYFVFKPDIYYKADESGESALSSVSSAVRVFSNIPNIDTSRLGIQGCSWGGFETNYIVSHCDLFKAACTASGPSDLMGFATLKFNTIYTSFYYGQFRMKTMVWEDYKPYVNNSPIFQAAKINTPLLIFHTNRDDAVPFNQGVQLFLVLRKLKKQAWLLEYGGGANHGVYSLVQKMDFGIRLSQFFDSYLLSKPAALWMASD